jgi:sensor histidine kinase YesM
LHSIAELVRENPKVAEESIVRLGGLLRKSLDCPIRHEVPLAEEIEFVRSYLEIEQLRLGERLSIKWRLAPDAMEVAVPCMILQPLVENAIQHGLAESEAGQIEITAWRTDDLLHVQVRDNGPGMTGEVAGTDGGIGLANTEARLRKAYGDRQHFEWRNDHGLVVSMRFPASTLKEQEFANLA